MAATPLPREPLSGTCDASGNASLKYRAPAHFYIHLYVAIQVSAGTPAYALTLGSSSPLMYGQGNQTQLGPVMLQPGEVMTISVVGATAAATVIAQVIGWQSAQPEELIPLLPLQPTAIAVSTTLSPPNFTPVFMARRPLAYATIGAAGVLAEAMLTLAATDLQSGLPLAGNGGSTYGVPAGFTTLRLLLLILNMKLGAAAVNTSRFALRINKNAAVATTDPAVVVAELTPQAALANVGATVPIPFPDGLELTGAMQFGLSHIGGATTNVESVSLYAIAHN